MQVGDLVKIEKWCKNKGALAVVVRTEDWEPNAVWIKYLDPAQNPNKSGKATLKNLILVSGTKNASR
tara:strand:+ start:379 stop:579 length:201 start_codon:yes stop_codon:yes gene_type:complete